MRRLAAMVVAVAAIAALAAPVAAAPTTGDFVSGSGYRISPEGVVNAQFKVDARNAGSGATGSYSFKRTDSALSFIADVTCLQVSGNRTVIGGAVRRISAGDWGFGVGDLFLVSLVDNGDPYRHQPGPDLVSVTDVYLADDVAYPGCGDLFVQDVSRLVSGNVTVKDAP